jgi:hypothetical protein
MKCPSLTFEERQKLVDDFKHDAEQDASIIEKLMNCCDILEEEREEARDAVNELLSVIYNLEPDKYAPFNGIIEALQKLPWVQKDE